MQFLAKNCISGGQQLRELGVVDEDGGEVVEAVVGEGGVLGIGLEQGIDRGATATHGGIERTGVLQALLDGCQLGVLGEDGELEVVVDDVGVADEVDGGDALTHQCGE